jgi:hypothetical protein
MLRREDRGRSVDESGGRTNIDGGETAARPGRSRFRSAEVDWTDTAPGFKDDAGDQSGEPEL